MPLSSQDDARQPM